MCSDPHLLSLPLLHIYFILFFLSSFALPGLRSTRKKATTTRRLGTYRTTYRTALPLKRRSYSPRPWVADCYFPANPFPGDGTRSREHFFQVNVLWCGFARNQRFLGTGSWLKKTIGGDPVPLGLQICFGCRSRVLSQSAGHHSTLLQVHGVRPPP